MKGINNDMGMDRGGKDQRKNWRSRLGAMARRYCGRGAVVLAFGVYSLAIWQLDGSDGSGSGSNLIAGGALAQTQNIQPAPSVNPNTLCDPWAIRNNIYITGCPLSAPSANIPTIMTNSATGITGTFSNLKATNSFNANGTFGTNINGQGAYPAVFDRGDGCCAEMRFIDTQTWGFYLLPNNVFIISDDTNGVHALSFNVTNDNATFEAKLYANNDATHNIYGTGVGASTNANVQAPTGTASTTGVMMGLAGAITPATSGNVMLSCWSEIKSPTAQTGVQGQITVYMGTGSAPTNGATLTGSAGAHNQVQFNGLAAATMIPLSTGYMFKGLTVGTAYWYDVALLSSNGADTVALSDLNCTAVEQY